MKERGGNLGGDPREKGDVIQGESGKLWGLLHLRNREIFPRSGWTRAALGTRS